MIVYIFCNDFFKKLFLPTRVVGVYPVYYRESRVLVNIEAIDGEWHIKPADNFSVLVNGNEETQPSLSTENTYIILNGTIHVYLMAAPLYVPNTPRYKLSQNGFSLGTSINR